MALVDDAQRLLAALADPAKAPAMQAYMKTDMPFLGVQSKPRRALLKELAAHAPTSQQQYIEQVAALWQLPHREEKYLAIDWAQRHKRFIRVAALPLYQQLIREGAWWDFVDAVASPLVGRLVVDAPDELWPVIDGWVDHEDMWLRRSAIICQLRSKQRTDSERLFRYCAARAHEKEFFVRKAIGWALREYAKTAPAEVIAFLRREREGLSGLSWREATKHLDV